MIEMDDAMAKSTKKGNTPLVAFRLPPELAERLAKHQERMSKAHPGVRFTFTDVLIEVLTRGLDAAESADKRRKG